MGRLVSQSVHIRIGTDDKWQNERINERHELYPEKKKLNRLKFFSAVFIANQ